MTAAVVLAMGNLATLIVAGHPWSITCGFTLWGAKAAVIVGWLPSSSPFWRDGWPADALAGSVHGWLWIAAALPGTWLGDPARYIGRRTPGSRPC